MFNSYVFNTTQFNSLASFIVSLDEHMQANIYINNEQLNLTVDNNQMSIYINNDICELIIDGK